MATTKKLSDNDKLKLAIAIKGRCMLRGNFTLRSGKVSNIYFDKYKFETDPHLMKKILLGIWDLVDPREFNYFAGLEMGGIPLASVFSYLTETPCLFVRKEAKEYGTCKCIEGAGVYVAEKISGNLNRAHILMMEDVVSSGGSVLSAYENLKKEGGVVKSVVCVIDRQMGGRELLEEQGISFYSLFTMEELLNV